MHIIFFLTQTDDVNLILIDNLNGHCFVLILLNFRILKIFNFFFYSLKSNLVKKILFLSLNFEQLLMSYSTRGKKIIIFKNCIGDSFTRIHLNITSEDVPTRQHNNNIIFQVRKKIISTCELCIGH